MNLVMKRMEETKKIRMKMRQKLALEEEEKFRKKEMVIQENGSIISEITNVDKVCKFLITPA